MTTVLQMTHRLTTRPQTPAVEGATLRHYRGSDDIEVWLDLRRRAFARQKLGVRDWAAEDFCREFLEKGWWRPETMWFAEASSVEGEPPRAVGTITLARRGEGPGAKPVVHWLAVRPGFRGRGIGRLLLATLEAAVWDDEGRQVWLETHSAWAQAARLYTAAGYVPAD